MMSFLYKRTDGKQLVEQFKEADEAHFYERLSTEQWDMFRQMSLSDTNRKSAAPM
jgi:hypothetical protein